MIFDIKNTNELSEEDFRNPSSVYRGLPSMTIGGLDNQHYL